MAADLFHPSVPFALAAVLVLFAGPRLGKVAALLAPVAAAVALSSLREGWTLHLLGQDLVLARAGAMPLLFALAFTAFSFIAALYSLGDDARGARAASLGLAGGGVGVALAGDLLTLFTAWEWLSISSLYLVWIGGTKSARAAGSRYFYFHLAGGMCFLAGIVLRRASGAPLLVGPIALGDASSWLILIAMLTNAAVPPLHAWLPDAYPEATPRGTVVLSAFTTKAAVFALASTFAGAPILAWAGAAMALYGVVFAVLENDIRRLLAYHIVSQVGYMVAGVGIGTKLAIDGVSAHAFSHIFYKGLLLMAAGAVVHATGRGKLTELGGVGRLVPATFALYMIGAFSISGVPLFNGFISKSMVVSAAGEARLGAVELMLVVASMGTFLHTGLKLPYFTFLARPYPGPTEALRPVPKEMLGAMALAACVCLATGVAPSLLYEMLPHGGDYHPFTAEHVITSLELLVATALGFWLLRAKLGGEPTVTRDVDRLYRGPLAFVLGASGRALEQLGALAPRAGSKLRPAIEALRTPRTGGGSATVAWQVGVLAVAIAALLGVLHFAP